MEDIFRTEAPTVNGQEGTMKRRVTFVAVAIAALSVGYALIMQRTGHAAEPASAVAKVASEHAGHVMTAAEHVAMMAEAGDVHAAHALEELAWPPLQAAPNNPKLPADADGAKARVASSPRKGEYVKIPVNGKPIVNWVVYPQGNAKAPVVVVIQEVFGLSDWIRGVADQLAAEGFIAVAPDLLTGRGPNGGDTPSFPDDMARVAATRAVPTAEVTAMLKAAREWGLKLPQASGKSASVGFCFGGGESFRLALDEPNLNAAIVYYGTSPTDAPPAQRGAPPVPFEPSARLADIKTPVLGLYGGIAQDVGIGRTVAPTVERMRALMKTYEPHIFDGAAHGFLRAQTGNNGANMRASELAWPMTVEWIKKYAGSTPATF
jgi:carboxymethylenebutenolidase